MLHHRPIQGDRDIRRVDETKVAAVSQPGIVENMPKILCLCIVSDSNHYIGIFGLEHLIGRDAVERMSSGWAERKLTTANPDLL
jgi:hypothetical protein